MPKNLVVVCLVNFFIAAAMGLALRFSFIETIPFNYRFLTHAHSHLAMLGWVYLMLYVCFVHYFVPNKHPIYNRLFWLTELAVIGMVLSFPYQGYAVISITFSTLHILCSYYFVYLIWKEHRTTSIVTAYLLKVSLLFMVLSTFGVWCLGPAVSMQGKASAFYNIAIQFFLHFQFNGWFLIAVLAVLFHLLQIENSRRFQRFFILLILSTILTLALPIQWFVPHDIFLWINSFAVILQLFVFYDFYKLVKPKFFQILKRCPKLVVYMYLFAIGCFILKMVIQTISILPTFSQEVYTHRNFIIGFIHLVMLGVISGFLLSFILQSKLFSSSVVLKVGMGLFVLGFLLTEALIMIQGYKFYSGSGLLDNYYVWLFVFSILFPVSLLLLVVNALKQKYTKHLF